MFYVKVDTGSGSRLFGAWLSPEKYRKRLDLRIRRARSTVNTRSCVKLLSFLLNFTHFLREGGDEDSRHAMAGVRGSILRAVCTGTRPRGVMSTGTWPPSSDSSLIICMAAKRDDGQFWDLGTREERLEQMQQERQTELLIGSAPCISFRTQLHPSEKGTKQQIQNMQDEKRQHTQACIKAYKRQLSMGRHFLHEHPVHASNLCMPEMREFLNDGRIHLVQGPMCRWRMTATDDRDERRLVRGKTRWSSTRLATLLG